MKILILFLVFSSFFVFWGTDSFAACSDIGNRAIFWGDDSKTDVIRAKGGVIKMNVQGEEGCAVQQAIFHIYNDKSQKVSEAIGTLAKGDNLGAFGFNLFFFWKSDLENGDYKFRLFKVGNSIINSKFSSNELKISDEQKCNLSKITVNPLRIKLGEAITLTVVGEGECAGSEVSVVARNESRRLNEPNPPKNQTFSGNLNTLTFQWGPQENFYAPAKEGQAVEDIYHFVVNLGSQSLDSRQFIVEFVGEGGGKEPGPISFKSFPFLLIRPEGTPKTLEGLIDIISIIIFNTSIPIAVILIVAAGIVMLTSSGNPQRVQKAKDILRYTIIGLAIVFIGRGFISLIIGLLGGGP